MVCNNGLPCTWADPGLHASSGPVHVGHLASLKRHLLIKHGDIFFSVLGPEVSTASYMDDYEEACKEKERQHVPSVSISVDRRSLLDLQEVLQPDSVQCLMCFVCSERHLCIRDMDRDGKIVGKGDIAYHTIGELNRHANTDVADRKFKENLYFKTFCDG